MTKFRSSLSSTSIAAIGLAVLSVAAFADVIFGSGRLVLSFEYTDTYLYFAHARAFAAEEILSGNLPLWNPHVFAGQPFLGGFQSALLYPANAIYLALPLDWAINLDISFHVFLMGLFGMLWARARGMGPLASFYAGAVMMLCGAVTVRILAGQLTVLAAACWTPAILGIAERLERGRSAGWTLAGIAAVTLQLLAGYPFYFYVSAMLVVLVLLPRVIRKRPDPRIWAGLVAVGLVPIAIGAVQLWMGVATADESMRAGGVPFWFGASFSLPPATLLMTVAPAVFGEMPGSLYWGGLTYWDACVFVGVTTVVLAVVGAVRGERDQRRGAVILGALMLVLAMGDNTPVYRMFFDWLPGFDSFRAPSKFALQASLFIALLAGCGLDRVLRSESAARLGVYVAGGGAVALAAATAWLLVQASSGPSAGAFGEFAVRVIESQNYLDHAQEAVQLALGAAAALGVAALTAAVAAGLFALRKRSQRAVWAIAALGILEVWVFAATHHGQFDLDALERPKLERFYRERAGTDRVLDVNGRNHATAYRGRSVWGYDPVQLGRYGNVAATLQYRNKLKYDPDYRFPLVPKLDHYNPILRLVRCRWIVEDSSFRIPPIEKAGAWPRVRLLGRAKVVDPESILDLLTDPEFEPRRIALVEEALEPPPEPKGARGSVFIGDESTDHLTLQVDLPAPALAVVTDSYSVGWRAVVEGDRESRELQVVPVDSFLIGIALPAGQYKVRLEYAPIAFRAGRWISGGSLALYLGAVVWWWLKRGRQPAVESA